MSHPLSSVDGLVIIVKDYKRTDSGVVVQWLCTFREEVFVQSSSTVPLNPAKSTQEYLTEAFQSCKEPIRLWVEAVSTKPSVVGTEFVVTMEDLLPIQQGTEPHLDDELKEEVKFEQMLIDE